MSFRPLNFAGPASDTNDVTTIRATCPQCGEVDITPEAILLSLRHPTGLGSYRFSCPGCFDTVEKPADRKVMALLLSAGVELEDAPAQAEMPLEAPEAIEQHFGGPPFTVDDLITGEQYQWGEHNYVRLDPHYQPAHVLHVRRL